MPRLNKETFLEALEDILKKPMHQVLYWRGNGQFDVGQNAETINRELGQEPPQEPLDVMYLAARKGPDVVLYVGGTPEGIHTPMPELWETRKQAIVELTELAKPHKVLVEDLGATISRGIE